MKKKFVVAMVALVLALGCVSGLTFAETVPVFAEEGDRAIRFVDYTYNVGIALPGFDNTGVEKVTDDTADGGDVVFHTKENDAGDDFDLNGNVLYNQNFVHCTTPIAANGLEMQFYMNSSSTLDLVLSSKPGPESWTAYSCVVIRFNPATSTVDFGYIEDGNGQADNPTLDITGRNVTLYNDYDYFADKAAGFKGTDVGTRNTLLIKSSGGSLGVIVNGRLAGNLSQKENELIAGFEDGAYFGFFESATTTGGAWKVTDMTQKDISWEEGMPNGWWWEWLDEIVMHKTAEDGSLLFKNVANENWDYYFQNNTRQYISNVTMQFAISGLTPTDIFRIHFDVHGGGPVLSFTAAQEDTAVLTVYYKEKGDNGVADWETLGTQTVPFYNDGATVNAFTLREIVAFALSVNGTECDIDLSRLFDYKTYLEEEWAADEEQDGPVEYNACPQFDLTADGEVIVNYRGVSSTAGSGESESAEGFAADDGTTIKQFDGKPLFFTNRADGNFRVRYTAARMYKDAFGVNFRLGKYGTNNGKFTVALTDNDSDFYGDADTAILMTIRKTETATTLTASLSHGGTVTTIGSGEVDGIDFDYEGDAHTISFLRTSDGYYMYFDGLIAAELDKSALDAVASEFENGMASLEFIGEGDIRTAFTMDGFDYHVKNTATPSGFVAGPTTTLPSFGYAGSGETAIIFADPQKDTLVKTAAVVLDGFTMTAKTFYNGDEQAPRIVLAKSSDWFNLAENGTAISFEINPVAADPTKAEIWVRYTDLTAAALADRVLDGRITDFTVDWHWNDNVANTLQLRKNGANWEIVVNGTPAAVETVTLLNERVDALQAADAENRAHLQMYGGKNHVYYISEIAEYHANNDPVATGAFDANTDVRVGKEVTLALSDIFTDADDDTLTYVLSDGSVGAIEGGVWKYTPDTVGEKSVTVECFDGKGGFAEYTFSFTVKAQEPQNKDNGKKKGCGSAATAMELLGLLAVLGAAAFVKRV